LRNNPTTLINKRSNNTTDPPSGTTINKAGNKNIKPPDTVSN
jgi:hypothetical protein